jgi:hypothetical protein
MQASHKNFRGQLDDELVLCYFRRHWVAIAIPLFLIPLCFAALILGLFYAPPLMKSSVLGTSLLTLVLLAVTGLMHHQFAVVFRYYLSTVIVTNLRVVILDKSVFFHDAKTTVDIVKIQEIQNQQVGIFHHLLNFGTIILDLSASEPVRISLVPQPDFYFKKMNEVKKRVGQQLLPLSFEPPPQLARVPQEHTSSVVPFLQRTPVE